MENQISAEETLKQIFIKQAIPADFQYNPAYTEENRELLTKISIEKKLKELKAAIVVENGTARVVRAENPDLELYDEAQNRVTLQSLVPAAIASLGTAGSQAAVQNNSNSIQHISSTEYVKDGVRHYKDGNKTYIDSTDIRRKQLMQPRPRTVEEHLAQLNRELGINP